jgi:hypothetical protein
VAIVANNRLSYKDMGAWVERDEIENEIALVQLAKPVEEAGNE